MILKHEQKEIRSSIPHPLVYDTGVKIAEKTLHWGSRLINVGLENVPTDEPLLIIANHRSNDDMLAIASAFQRVGRLRFIAKDTVTKKPLIGPAVKKFFGVIPIDQTSRGLDVLTQSLETFNYPQDPYLAVFPEGVKIDTDVREIKKVTSLVARIACYGQVKTLPVGIARTEKHKHILGFNNTVVAFGEPIDPPEFSARYDSENLTLGRMTRSDVEAVRKLQIGSRFAIQTALDNAYSILDKNN